jgi:O-acetyl-ADP-ribose deacetylase (regulator of RNase III)
MSSRHAVITLAGNLPAKAVIHAVGPVWHGGDQHEASILEEAYRNCLRLAADNGYKTMAFPAISTGCMAILRRLPRRSPWKPFTATCR